MINTRVEGVIIPRSISEHSPLQQDEQPKFDPAMTFAGSRLICVSLPGYSSNCAAILHW